MPSHPRTQRPASSARRQRPRQRVRQADFWRSDLEQIPAERKLPFAYGDSTPSFAYGDSTPILISTDGQPEEERQVLISPSPELPASNHRFERLCEPLDHDPEIRQAGRKRHLCYRDDGHPLAHHQVG